MATDITRGTLAKRITPRPEVAVFAKTAGTLAIVKTPWPEAVEFA